MRKKWYFLSSIFLACLACFGISGHANAIEIVMNLEPTGWEVQQPKVDCYVDFAWHNNAGEYDGWCWKPSTYADGHNVGIIRTVNNYTVTKGNYYIWTIELKHWQTSSGSGPAPINWKLNVPDGWTGIDIKSDTDWTAMQETAGTIGYQSYVKKYTVIVRAESSGSKKFVLGTDNNLIRTDLAIQDYDVVVRRITEYKWKADDTEESVSNALESQADKEKEEIQDASDDGEDAADDASSGAESATQNLTGAITDIVNVFRTAQPSNCKISLIRGNFNTGELDLCAVPNQIKTMIQVFIAIPITLSVLRVAYSMVMFYLNRIRKEQE